MALGYREINAEAFRKTLGSVLKSAEDIDMIKAADLAEFNISP